MVMQRILIVLLIVCTGLLGCAPAEKPENAPRTEPAMDATEGDPSPLSALWSELSGMYVAGETNAMLDRLSAAMADPAFASVRDDIFREYFAFQVRLGRFADAQALFLDALQTDAASVEPVFGFMENRLLRDGAHDALTAWLDQIEATGALSAVMQTRLLGFRLDLLRAQGKTAEFMALLETCAARLPDGEALAVMHNALRGLLDAQAFETLAQAVDLLEARAGGDPSAVRLAVRLRMDAMLAQDQLDEAYAMLQSAGEALTPEDRARYVMRLVQAGQKTGRQAFAERVCDDTLAGTEPDSPVFGAAANEWIELARQAHDAALVQQRFAALVQKGLPVSALTRMLNNVFYFVVKQEDMTVLAALLNDATVLAERAENKLDRARLATLLLDASFLTEDYDRAIQLLEAGIPDKDQLWYDTLLPKVKAHRAMALGKPEDAITHFRTFMELVSGLNEGFPDPLTGAMVSRESILGLNAKRIADLWMQAGRPDEAAAARAEASTYYRKALEQEQADSPAAREIEAALKELER
jgi:tetratricopeptide (TPR) repeat protein